MLTKLIVEIILLSYTPETNIMLYINYISINKKTPEPSLIRNQSILFVNFLSVLIFCLQFHFTYLCCRIASNLLWKKNQTINSLKNKSH